MPESSPDLAYTPAHVLRDLIAARRLSPVELMQFTLDRSNGSTIRSARS